MLERLNTIRWSEFTDSSGSNGAEIPALIHRVTSGAAAERKAAVNSLRERLWKQGQVFEATAHAVPFLLELLPGSLVEAELCLLLGLIAESTSYGPPESAALADASFAAVRAGLPVYLELMGRPGKTQAQTDALVYLVFHLHEDREAIIPLLRPLMAPTLEWMIDIGLSPPAPTSETRSAYGLLGAQALNTIET
ncbi:hypothetical protein [Stigmatella aurantiaca]|nr:hypothetical protein [Stigmatella aurantiaca]EAU63695.1 conserved hypothetical protein [Stigmatella aurantiaca DW4/3-1]